MTKYKINDRVEFDDGRGTRITGKVIRANWGLHGRSITIKTDDNRTFFRDVAGSAKKLES